MFLENIREGSDAKTKTMLKPKCLILSASKQVMFVFCQSLAILYTKVMLN
jgi:hypothetical protein